MCWALVLAPFFLVMLLNWGPGPPGEMTDTYHYLMHARSLAEGRGLTDTGYIFSELNPWLGPPVQPPGLPLVLFPLVMVFGEGLLAVRLLSVLFAVGFLLLVGRYFATHDGLAYGLGVTLLLSLLAQYPVRATFPHSDYLAAIALWVVIAAVDAPRRFDWQKILLITAAGGVASLTRLTGVSLFVALVLFGLVRYRELYLRPFIPAALWLVGGLGALFAFGVVVPDWVYDGMPVSVTVLIRGWYYNLISYRLALLENMLYPFPWELANDAYHLVGALLMVIGFFAWLRTGWNRFVLYFAFSYMMMLLSLPVSGGERYFWPVAPLMMFLMLRGGRAVFELTMRAMPPRRLDAVVVAMAVVIASVTFLMRVTTPRSPALVENPELQRIFTYVRAIDEADNARVAFHYPRLLTWETKKRAMALPNRGPLDRRVEEFRIRGITHVVSSESLRHRVEEQLLREALRQRPEAFSLAHQGDGFAVYRVE